MVAAAALRSAHSGWVVAAACAALLGVALQSRLASDATAWMHRLLSCSNCYGLPDASVADVAVVLGYALHRNGCCTRPLQSRVAVGVDLFQQGHASHLIFSGAHPGGGTRGVSEANAMADYAAQLVGGDTPPPGRWLLEDRSTSTRTNAVYSLAMVQQQQQQQDEEEGASPSSSLGPQQGPPGAL